MNTKPFSWIVRLTVSPLWVADGFTIDDARAHDMLTDYLPHVRGDEVEAVVLEAPSPLHIAAVQGYGTKRSGNAQVIHELIAGVPHNNTLRSALIAARDLLDSVAFVSKEGDTTKVLEKLNVAIEAINARQGDTIEIDA